MFIKKKHINEPNSPRKLNLESWLGGKGVNVTNQTQETRKGEISNFDINPDSIQEGFVHFSQNSRHVYCVYKIPAGLYDLTYNDDEYAVPLPDIMILLDAEYKPTQEYKYQDIRANLIVNTDYRDYIPLTNLYESTYRVDNHIRTRFYNQCVYSNICTGNRLQGLVGTPQTHVEYLNQISAVIHTFMFDGNNDDLEPSDLIIDAQEHMDDYDITYLWELYRRTGLTGNVLYDRIKHMTAYELYNFLI